MPNTAKIILAGSPNVGKSVIFNYLTGAYVTVSNYPGTTVDVARGKCRHQGKEFEVIDTPGIYSIIPITDEERVTRELLEEEDASLIVHVVDAKNLGRMLPLTLQFLEAGLPVVLVVNLIDEAEAKGIRINSRRLSELLGIPVVATTAVRKVGLEELKRVMCGYSKSELKHFSYSPELEEGIARLEKQLYGDHRFTKRALALLTLQGDRRALRQVEKQNNSAAYFCTLSDLLDRFSDPEYRIGQERQVIADKILSAAVSMRRGSARSLSDRLGRLTREPLLGIPILCLILYWGLYKFVGRFGAGFLVDYMDKEVFAAYIFPIARDLVYGHLPWEWLQSLIMGDYGLFSLGIRYATVIVLPIVGTFFLMFAVLEDSGYLPRLALLADSLFKRFGLNGRAVIPVTLGLGCGTMAVMVARTLESKRERLLATFLLSLAVPCSAQFGVVLALLSHSFWMVALWTAYIGAVFVIAGWVAVKIIPGERSAFYMELPPLRLPLLSNVCKKAYSRMILYFTEILPVFLLTSLLLWGADQTGLLTLTVKGLSPVMKQLGLPPQTAEVFISGFFRRDYGAAGLYDMTVQGLLDERQLVTAAITLTLFVPCVAQFMVMVKERGLIASVIMLTLIIMTAMGSGILINVCLSWIM
ncbi:MAG: ferrous iron transport protein B [Negativicutes bacterium]|nr:ferrous iron transport protein B [Negativicutes bacterium]